MPVQLVDRNTNQYTSFYEEIPNAIVVYKTKEEAEKKLRELIERMWIEEQKV